MLKIFRYTGIALAVGAFTSVATAAPVKRILPKDECLHIDGYFELRQKFEGIVQRRDSKAFMAMVSPAISWTFGGGDGKDAFAKEWKIADGKASPIWAELDEIVRIGCAPDDKIVTMPHLFKQDTGPDETGAGQALVLGPEVKLRTGPSTATAQKALLNWELVQTGDMDATEKWTNVTTADGKKGYVRNDYLRGVLDYRIGFERKPAGWQIIYFIAGD
jgi:hypothetical protein